MINWCNRLVLWVSSKLTPRGSSCTDKTCESALINQCLILRKTSLFWHFPKIFLRQISGFMQQCIKKNTQEHSPTKIIEPVHPSGCPALIRSAEWVKGVNKSACASASTLSPVPRPCRPAIITGPPSFSSRAPAAALLHRSRWCHCHYASLVQRGTN